MENQDPDAGEPLLSHSLPTAASWLRVLVTSQSVGSLPSRWDDGVFQAMGQGAEDAGEP